MGQAPVKRLDTGLSAGHTQVSVDRSSQKCLPSQNKSDMFLCANTYMVSNNSGRDRKEVLGAAEQSKKSSTRPCTGLLSVLHKPGPIREIAPQQGLRMELCKGFAIGLSDADVCSLVCRSCQDKGP